MRLPSTRFLRNALPGTISAVAIALLLSIAARPAVAQTGVEPVRIGHLEALLVQHDVRYAFRMAERDLVGCPSASGVPQPSVASVRPTSVGAASGVAIGKQVAQEHAR